MKIIVTGGAGFIGGNFVHYMMNKYPDYKIVCLDNLTYAGNLSTLDSVMDNPNFTFAKGDIADREYIYQLFETEKPDMVVNFAAESHVLPINFIYCICRTINNNYKSIIFHSIRRYQC